MHRFEDAAFTQDFLLHNINAGGYFSDLCNGYQKSRWQNMPEGTVRSVVGNALLRADPIYVSDDVLTLWQHASETFKLEQMQRTDLVVPCGFALLPRPFEFHDRAGKLVKIRALSWLPVSTRETYNWDEGEEGQGVWVSLISHVDDRDDYWQEDYEFSEETRHRMRSYGYNGNFESGEKIWERAKEHGWDWSLMHGAPLMFEVDLGVVKEGEDPSVIESVKTVWGHIQCFWRLMSQLVMTQESLPRQARRQRQRAGKIDTVKVLRLRRSRTPQEHEGEGAGIAYTHRWVVSGHWRNQPYGSKKDRSYKQIWIAPYVKGPEDKPIVVKRRGVEFDR